MSNNEARGVPHPVEMPWGAAQEKQGESGAALPGGEVPESQEGEPLVIRQGLLAYLRCMWSLLWTAFRHPLTTTVIDWETGRVLSDEDAAEVLEGVHG